MILFFKPDLFFLGTPYFSKSSFQIRHEICGNRIKIRYFVNHRFVRNQPLLKLTGFLKELSMLHIFLQCFEILYEE